MSSKVRAAIVCMLLVLCGYQTALALTIKLGSLAPGGSPWDKGLRQLAAEWSSLSNGTVKFKIYPGGIAGDEEDMIRKMRIGQLNAAGLSGMGLCRIFSGILAVQLPLLVRTDEELRYVLGKMRSEFEGTLEAKGFKVIIWSNVGWAHFFSKRPVVDPDDMRGHKLFTYAGDPDGEQAWKDAGFHSVPLSITDLMSSLQSGMVDAFTTTPLTAASYQWFALAPNMCGMKWAPLIGGVVVSTKSWKKIPAKLHAKLLEAAARIGETLQAETDDADEQAVEVMKQHGLTINPVSPEAEQRWKAETEAAFLKVAGKAFDAASYERVKQHLRDFRQTNDK